MYGLLLERDVPDPLVADGAEVIACDGLQGSEDEVPLHVLRMGYCEVCVTDDLVAVEDDVYVQSPVSPADGADAAALGLYSVYLGEERVGREIRGYLNGGVEELALRHSAVRVGLHVGGTALHLYAARLGKLADAELQEGLPVSEA